MEDKKMNEILTKENIKIEDMIFEVRGKQVILSSNVAPIAESFNIPLLISIPTVVQAYSIFVLLLSINQYLSCVLNSSV